ncbi:hypothetical protein [Sphingobium sp. MK2]|uniref:hypothetical protein n=1 Tax=Sphingobium sp. MK2 TaxID=3116540 RepID=UPI0032E36073
MCDIAIPRFPQEQRGASFTADDGIIVRRRNVAPIDNCLLDNHTLFRPHKSILEDNGIAHGGQKGGRQPRYIPLEDRFGSTLPNTLKLFDIGELRHHARIGVYAIEPAERRSTFGRILYLENMVIGHRL